MLQVGHGTHDVLFVAQRAKRRREMWCHVPIWMSYGEEHTPNRGGELQHKYPYIGFVRTSSYHPGCLSVY